jgi:exosortase A-associated hydrolase 1
MSYSESVLDLRCGGAQLAGILACPESAPRTAIVLVVGGPQYRVGSHRQFLLLSRRLAAAGHAVLRFDYRGMGDSDGAQRSFEDVNDDIAAAVDALQQALPSVQQVMLWGLCDGASAALLYCEARPDPRIGGLCLVNPWVRSAESLARTQVRHYYLDRLKQGAFWKKLLSGRVAASALSELWAKLKMVRSAAPAAQSAMPYQLRMAKAWRAFPGRILLLLSEQDLVAREFADVARSDAGWSGALQRPQVEFHELQGCDHTCSDARSRAVVETFTLAWCQTHAAK